MAAAEARLSWRWRRSATWDGKDGVGSRIGRLTGGRTFFWFMIDGQRKRRRAYAIPITITRLANSRAFGLKLGSLYRSAAARLGGD